MKEAYAVRRTVRPSAEIEARIEHMLSVGVGENPRESLSELARLGARLIIQRAVEDEFDAWLGRARYERRPDGERGLRHYGAGLRNGFRARRVQTAEGGAQYRGPEGGRAGGLGIHRRRRARLVGGDAGDARVLRGLGDARPGSDRARAGFADADRG